MSLIFDPVNKKVPADYVAVHMTFKSLAWLITYLGYRKEQQKLDRLLHLTPYILFVLVAFIIDSCYFMIGDISEWWWEFNDQGNIEFGKPRLRIVLKCLLLENIFPRYDSISPIIM